MPATSGFAKLVVTTKWSAAAGSTVSSWLGEELKAGVGGGDRRAAGLGVVVIEGGGALAGGDDDAGDRVAAGLARVEGAGRAGRAQADRLVAGGRGPEVAVGVLELHRDLRPAARDEGQRRAGDRHLAGRRRVDRLLLRLAK